MPAEDASRTRWIRVRMSLCAAGFFLLFALVMARAVQLEVVQGNRLGDLARDQYLRELALQPRRGPIFDSRGRPLAISVETDSLFLDPKTARQPAKSAKDAPPLNARAVARLGKALGLPLAPLRRKLALESSFVWLERRVTTSEARAALALHLKGVGVVKEYRRYYPQKELAAHVLGTVGIDGRGLEGVERAQDVALKGSTEEVESLRDVRGNVLFEQPGIPSGALQGASVQLTIDSTLQHVAEASLAGEVAKTRAKAGMAVVMDPQTGAVLALANVPTFNPNAPGRSLAARRDRAVTDEYEPGSVMKCFLMAGAITDRVITPATLVDVTGGVLELGRRHIHDAHKPDADAISATEVLATSSNVGASRIGLKLGPERLVAWYRAFGFGGRTDVGLPGEARGVLQNPEKMGDVATATTSFGQGMSASPMQLATALSALANGGTLMRPYVVAKVTRADGEVLIDRKPEAVRRVVSRQVARTVVEMMEAVVRPGGTGTRAAMPGFTVAGKTGTAQKADALTHRYGDKRFASFMGVVPAEAPKVAIYVALDEPETDVYGGSVAAPVFRDIALAALRELGVRPAGAPDALALAVQAQGAAKKLAKDEVEGAALDPESEDDTPDAPAGVRSLVVPDVKGLSARAVLRALGERSLEAQLSGSGVATKQRPPAGRSVAPGTRVSVVLGSG